MPSSCTAAPLRSSPLLQEFLISLFKTVYPIKPFPSGFSHPVGLAQPTHPFLYLLASSRWFLNTKIQKKKNLPKGSWLMLRINCINLSLENKVPFDTNAPSQATNYFYTACVDNRLGPGQESMNRWRDSRAEGQFLPVGL